MGGKCAKTVEAKFMLKILPRFSVEFELVGLMAAVVFEINSAKVVSFGRFVLFIPLSRVLSRLK